MTEHTLYVEYTNGDGEREIDTYTIDDESTGGGANAIEETGALQVLATDGVAIYNATNWIKATIPR